MTIRIPPELWPQLSTYMERTGASKTEIFVGALAQYQRMC